jgi:hypothetical protein
MLGCKSGDVSLVLRKNQGGHDDERTSTRLNRLLEDGLELVRFSHN